MRLEAGLARGGDLGGTARSPGEEALVPGPNLELYDVNHQILAGILPDDGPPVVLREPKKRCKQCHGRGYVARVIAHGGPKPLTKRTHRARLTASTANIACGCRTRTTRPPGLLGLVGRERPATKRKTFSRRSAELTTRRQRLALRSETMSRALERAFAEKRVAAAAKRRLRASCVALAGFLGFVATQVWW